MQKRLASNLKVTTIWPELANHRIQGLDSQLEEVRFETRGATLTVWGAIRRKVICCNGRNQLRKVEDRLQFAANLEYPSQPVQLGGLSLSDIELIQTGFVFQSQPRGGGPARLEQSFTLVVHCPPAQPVFRRKAVPVWAKLVIDKGQGKVVLDLPVGLLGSSRTPRHFSGSIRMQSPVQTPVIHGVLKGTIIYCSQEKELKELDFETAINFLLERPLRLKSNQQLWIAGDLAAARWRRALRYGPPGDGWRLEIKFQYHWRIIEERELWILAGDGLEGPSPGGVEKCAAITCLKKSGFQLYREYTLSDWGFEPGEIRVRLEECRERLTPAGLLLSGRLCFEASGTDNNQERVQTQVAPFEELAPFTGVCFQNEPPLQPLSPLPGQLLTRVVPTVGLAPSGFKKGSQRVGVLLSFLVSLCREEIIAIPPAGSWRVGAPATPILACLIGERREFTLEGEAILTLEARPRKIIKLKVRPLEAAPLVNDGWIGIDGRMEVVVGFEDERSRYYETAFTPFFQGAFNWDKLQLQDTVKVQCRLNHYSYSWEGPQICCRYWLKLDLENRREKEILVETAAPGSRPKEAPFEDVNPGDINSNDHKRWDSGEGRVTPGGGGLGWAGGLKLNPSKEDWVHSAHARRFIIAVEIPLKTGTAQEMGTSGLRLSGANLQRMKEGLIIEGALSGTIEYWDRTGFLKRETVELSFWRISQLRFVPNYPGPPWNEADLQLELLNVSITPVLSPPRGKGRIRVRFEVILCRKQMRVPGREGGTVWQGA
ncbi:MAG: hypothetical protein K6U80_17775 [Firmicutes bacterium]|nr:hypothetical protein [Bacillota bacterium]